MNSTKLKICNKYIASSPEVATMTLISSLNTDIDLINLSKYISLSEDCIHYVKFMRKEISIERSLYENAPIKKRLKKKKKSFYNQCTLNIKLNRDESKKSIMKKKNKIPLANVKIFLNGKIQMTGCQSVDEGEYAMIKLIEELNKKKYKLVNNKLEEIFIISNKELHTTNNDTKLEQNKIKIVLINSVFSVGFNINREKLYDIIFNEYNIRATYQPCIYPAVNIKYIPNENKQYFIDNNKKISIFVFQTGKIIITAAESMNQVYDSYNHINTILEDHFDDICKEKNTLINNENIKKSMYDEDDNTIFYIKK